MWDGSRKDCDEYDLASQSVGVAMPVYKQTAVTAKEGINFIRTVTEGAGSIFNKIEGRVANLVEIP